MASFPASAATPRLNGGEPSRTNRTWAEIFSFGRERRAAKTPPPLARRPGIHHAHSAGRFGPAAASRIATAARRRKALSIGLPRPDTGVENHFAVTWDTVNDVQRLYVNGVLVGSSPLLIDLVDVEDVNNWLGRSQWADPLFDGLYNEFRIYDRR